MSKSNTGFGENYAGQSRDITLPGEMTSELSSAWKKAHMEGKLPEEIEASLIERAHRGSTLAANMLHLSNVEWDYTVGGETYSYGSATFHGDLYTKDVRVQYAGSKDCDES